MAIELKIPELGENVTGGTVASVLVKIGDSIEKDQPLVELETEKAVLEVPAESGGVVKEILTKAGDEIQVGDTIVVLDAQDSSAPAPKTVEAPAKETVPALPPAPEKTPSAPVAVPSSEPSDVVIPELGENVTGGTVANVLVAVGDLVKKDQGLVELETEKAVLEVPSPLQGKVEGILVKIGDEVQIGQAIAKIADDGAAPVETTRTKPAATVAPEPAAMQAPTQPAPSQPKVETVSPPPAFGKRPPAAAAPSVRRFAREIGVDIHDVSGTGPGKRISIDDVKAYSKTLHQQNIGKAASGAAPLAAGPLPDFEKWGAIERESMSKVRDKTAVHLSNAWATIPHVTQFDKADITEMEKLRKQYGPKIEQAGGKLTMTAILLKVAASALKVFPQFNASVDMENKEIIYKKYINIGVAVDTDRGLLVPVIRDVDKKNLTDLAIELTEIAAKARDKKLTLEDMQGGNFTISNLGGIGGTYFTPIINAPEVAILGVSRGAFEPVYIDDSFVPRLKLPVSLSYDHRVIDGADGARFIRWIVEALEQPFALILEG